MPAQHIQFIPGKFYQFRAITKFALGNYGDVWQDDVVEFDGQTMRIGGQTFPAPNLRAAVKIGWLVPVQDTTSTYTPQPAGVQVHSATAAGSDRTAAMTIEAASEEEQVVGTVGTQKTQRDAAMAHAGRTTREAAQQPTPPLPPPAPPLEPAQQMVAAPAVQVDPPSAIPPAVQVDPPSTAPPAVLVPAVPVVYDQPVATQPVVYDQPPQPVSLPPQQPQAPKVALQTPPPQQAPGATLPPGVRRRPLSIDEANAKNEEILALALSEEVILPDDKEQAYYGLRHDAASSGKVATSGGKYEIVTGEEGVVARTNVQGGHGAQVGSEDEARRAASQRGLDVTKVSAAAVEFSVRPVATAPRVSVEDYERTMRAKLYGEVPEEPHGTAENYEQRVQPESVPQTEQTKEQLEIAILKAQLAELQQGSQAEAPAPVTQTVQVIPPEPPSPTGAQIIPAPPTATEVHQPVQTKHSTQVTEGVAIGETGAGGATGDVSEARAGDDLSDLLPEAASSGVPAAKIISDPDTFVWDTKIHYASRVKKAVDEFGDQPNVIRLIMAQESEAVKKRITSELKRLGKMD